MPIIQTTTNLYSKTPTNQLPRYVVSGQEPSRISIQINDNGFLSEYYEQVFSAIKPNHTNLLIAPVGYGKTTFTIKACLQHKLSIIIVPVLNLKNQTIVDVYKYVEENNNEVQIETTAKYIKMFTDQSTIYITTFQDLVNNMDFLHGADFLCVDECHWIFEYSFADQLTHKMSQLLCEQVGKLTILLFTATPNAFDMFPAELYVENIITCKVNNPKLSPHNIYLHQSNSIVSSIALCENFLSDTSGGLKGVLVSHKESCNTIEFGIEQLSNANLGLGYRGCNVAPRTMYNSLLPSFPELDFISAATQHNSETVKAILSNNSEQANKSFLATSVFSVGLNLKNSAFTDLLVISNNYSFIQQSVGRCRFPIQNLHLLDVKPYTNPNYKTLSAFELKYEMYKLMMDLKLGQYWNPFIILSNWWDIQSQFSYNNVQETAGLQFPNSKIQIYSKNNLPTNHRFYKQINSFYNINPKVNKLSFKRIWHVLTGGTSEKAKINNLCTTIGIDFNEFSFVAQYRGHKKCLIATKLNNIILTEQLLKQIIERNILNGNIKIQLVA